jgi:hypothetical protein
MFICIFIILVEFIVNKLHIYFCVISLLIYKKYSVFIKICCYNDIGVNALVVCIDNFFSLEECIYL